MQENVQVGEPDALAVYMAEAEAVRDGGLPDKEGEGDGVTVVVRLGVRLRDGEGRVSVCVREQLWVEAVAVTCEGERV